MTTSRLVLAFVFALSAGCDSKESGGAGKSSDGEASASEAKEQAADEAAGSKSERDEDRGSATVVIGGTKWAAEPCRAKPRKGAMKISCSKVDMKDGKVDREAIDLVLPDYDGPGDYKAGRMSNFTGVGLDTKKATDEENPDQAAKGAITDGIKGATVVMLDGTEVKVTKVDGGFVDGTFSKPADEMMQTPAFEEGTFHARLLEEKK